MTVADVLWFLDGTTPIQLNGDWNSEMSITGTTGALKLLVHEQLLQASVTQIIHTPQRLVIEADF